jgi:hypothetical protein
VADQVRDRLGEVDIPDEDRDHIIDTVADSVVPDEFE